MKKKLLSERLMKVVGMVSPCNAVCDVGCDHAFASIYMVKNGIAKKCIACDVGEGPLRSAGANISLYGLNEQIETRLGSGLSKVRPGEADCVIMAGMGGTLIKTIIEDDLNTAVSIKEWILEPQSDADLVRKLIRENGLVIKKEDMVTEADKIYPVIRAVKEGSDLDTGLSYSLPEDEDVDRAAKLGAGKETLYEVFDCFGGYLLKTGNKVLKTYLNKGLAKCDNVIKGINEAENADERSMVRLKEMEYTRKLTEIATGLIKED